jgi:hypothetical protein
MQSLFNHSPPPVPSLAACLGGALLFCALTRRKRAREDDERSNFVLQGHINCNYCTLNARDMHIGAGHSIVVVSRGICQAHIIKSRNCITFGEFIIGRTFIYSCRCTPEPPALAFSRRLKAF